MVGEFIAYLKIFLSIPAAYYLLAVSTAAATMVVVSAGSRSRQREVSKRRIAASGILAGWLFFTLAETVLCREPGTSRSMQLRLFWSYRSHIRDLQAVNLFNVLLLMPAGFLLPLVGVKRLWKTVLLGFLWSLLIESLQYATMRGLFEADDLFHNTLGACLGYLNYRLICRIAELIRKRKD